MRGGMPRRFACLLGTLAALCCAAPASAASPRIIDGHTASRRRVPGPGLPQRGRLRLRRLAGEQPLLPDGGPLRDGVRGHRAARPGRVHRDARQGQAVRLPGRRRMQRQRQRRPRGLRADRGRRQHPRSRRRAAPALGPGPAAVRAAAADRARRDRPVGARRKTATIIGWGADQRRARLSNELLEATVPMALGRLLRRRGHLRTRTSTPTRWSARAVARRTPAAATPAAR